jgi:hypothetical protein
MHHGSVGAQGGILGTDSLDPTRQRGPGTHIIGAAGTVEVVSFESEAFGLTHFAQEVPLRGFGGKCLLMLHTHPIGVAGLVFVATRRK